MLCAVAVGGVAAAGAVLGLWPAGGRAPRPAAIPAATSPVPPRRPHRAPVSRAERLRVAEQIALARYVRLGSPIYCGGSRGRMVALTFDDGPGPYTERALSILGHAHARATFFLVGEQLRIWPFLPILALQHGVLGDHTWTHPHLTRLGAKAIRLQLALTKVAIERETHVPVRLFRPPYGARDPAVDRVSRSLGLVEVLWSIDSRDSEGARWNQIAATVERLARPGSIILLHENHGQTIRALRFAILPFLRARRFVPVTVPELLALDPPSNAAVASGLGGCY